MLQNLFSSVLMLSIMASAVICVILITKFVFKERLSAKWHYYIWLLLVIRLVIPFTPQYSLDFGNLINHQQKAVSEMVIKSEKEHNGTPYTISDTKSESLKQETIDLRDNQLKAGSLEKDSLLTNAIKHLHKDNVNEISNNNSIGYVIETAAMVWAIGFIILLIYSLVINLIIRLRIKKTTIKLEQDRITSIIEECRKNINITKRIPVVYQRYVSAPALYGIVRPVLLMSPDIANQLKEDELRYVVLHELCHYRRKDNASGLILMLLNMVHWFNPLMWLAAHKIKEDRELVCDQQALTYVGSNEKRNYARTIVKILELFSESHFIQSASSIIQGRASNMEWRLKFIKAIKRKSAVLAICVTAVVILSGVLTINYINGKVKFPKSVYASSEQKDNTTVSQEKVDTLRGDILDRNGVKLVERTSLGSNYTYGNLASHVIGSVNLGNNGQGIEKLMDDEGMESNNITLTIDKNIQQITEDVLEQAVEECKVENGAAAIVMDPSTGEVLAMCSKPDFDLNKPDSAPKGFDPSAWAGMTDMEKVEYLTKTIWRNKAIMDTYEPASVFKAITAAAGIEEGVITPDTMVDDYTVNVAGHDINCWKPNFHGTETFEMAMYNSCNPPFVKIAQKLGIDTFYNYVRKFGLYDPTGIELLGERKSLIHKEPKEIDMAVASFGQRFQVTPIQVLSAYCAIANGGDLVKPQVIKGVYDSKGKTIEEFKPDVVRNVISEKTSKTLGEILEGVVSKGTGKKAYVEGYRIAGKTGTSETTVRGRYIASFVGFAPYDNPKVACIVIMDNPKGDSFMGGVIAAPAAGKIMKQSLDYIDKALDTLPN